MSKEWQTKIVLDLAKQNKFYFDEIFILLHRRVCEESEMGKLLKTAGQLEYSNTYFRNKQTNFEKIGYLAIDDFKLVGFAIVERHKHDELDFLQYLLVNEPKRYSGIGSLLLHRVIHEAHERQIEIETSSDESTNYFLKHKFKFKGISEHGFSILHSK